MINIFIAFIIVGLLSQFVIFKVFKSKIDKARAYVEKNNFQKVPVYVGMERDSVESYSSIPFKTKNDLFFRDNTVYILPPRNQFSPLKYFYTHLITNDDNVRGIFPTYLSSVPYRYSYLDNQLIIKLSGKNFFFKITAQNNDDTHLLKKIHSINADTVS